MAYPRPASRLGLLLLFGRALASPQCPCISNRTLPQHTSSLGNFTDGTRCALDTRSYNGETVEVCFPATYGLHRCNTDDIGFDPNCRGNSSEWSAYCAEPWCVIAPRARVVSRVNPLLTLARAPLLARASCRCYVDGDVCRDSVYSFWKSTTFEGLHWSYATCGGDESLWTDNVIITGLQGKTIRGAIPKSYYPMHFYLDDLGDPVASELVTSLADADRPKYGLWMEYYEELANRAGFTWEWVYTSSGSLHDQSSTWTACVQDVKQGLIDLCIGNFWTVEERLAMSSFVSPTFIDNFFLFVKRPAASQEIDGFAFLKPFSGRLWGLIFSAACIVACLYGLEQIDLGSLKRTREEEISPQQILRKVEKLMTKLARPTQSWPTKSS